MLPISAAQQPLKWNQAFFTACSALSTTGLSIITPSQDLSLFGQLVLLFLMQMGGIGFMTGVVAIFRLIGRPVTFGERLALRDSLGVTSVASILKLTSQVLKGVVAIELIGAAILFLIWLPHFGIKSALYYAIWHSVSAFCNASFDLLSGAPDAPVGFPTDIPTLLTISGLVMLGSIGIPVLSDLSGWVRRKARLSLHTRLTLKISALLLLLGTAALYLDHFMPTEIWYRRLALCFFHSATSRTSGFVIVPLDTIPHSSALVLTVLMFIGGSPASMGGGITTSTLIVLLVVLKSQATGTRQLLVGNRALPNDSVLKATAILFVALSYCTVVSWLLLLTQKATLTEAVFETVSAFSTCGFTLGLTTRLDLFGQLLIATTMLFGRLGLLSVVVAFASTNSGPRSISYPEEPILMA